ncbi:ANTAR domain-containing response regulator [Sulfurirhabdus autotrophica]|uniref:Response regulator receiver and ANTAR domain protein n=1 Tax=Sulfurirhabdus autotrophica TaxID=1706046 RepID=A0A4R3YGH7_9PROT|nr:response regulator [Sulfurirhabdus autotrophica]TCV89663.1 response regulator receiver and ANTAR domain protein [Sulfurirhabdus autotrophica]
MLKIRLLIADDDRLVLYSLSSGLREAGYEVLEASNADEAIQLCMNNKPDLALLDIRMPGMSGVELGKCMSDEFGVPFLFLSAYSDKETVSQATAVGAIGYLVKPLDIVQIVPAIEAALARATEFKKLRESSDNLVEALKNSRETSIAVGLVMERYALKEVAAFEALRSYARSERRRITDVAADVLAGEHALKKLREYIKS